MQNGTFNQCSGTLYDSGGAAGNYGNNENFVMTICPENAGDFVHLDFTVFNSQLNADILTIYDGDDTTGTVIGVYDGSDDPGAVQATTTSGCLTLEWVSNGAANTTGFAATIACATACQTITASIDSTTPAADGSGIVTVPLGDPVDFAGSAAFSESPDGATYVWNYDDGQTDNGTNVSHTYANPGTYNVTLTVTDPNPTGCSDTVTITVNVLGPYIVVDQTQYTTEELIEDVLVNSPCASVSNITSSTGSDFGSTNGIGYFISDGTSFPFASGIVMTTGNAANAEGPESGTLSDGGGGAWGGDTDLEAAIPALNSNNATFIEFDFVPLANTISFNFLFASDEYGTYQCSFADGFAFLLTDTTTSTTTNLAVVPGTTDPVSVLTIRDQQFNNGCTSENVAFFDSYYGPGGQPAINSPTNFLGHTVSLQAAATVTPNITYHIKLVIADHNDTAFDSAVFLEAGSFDLGGDLGDDITIAANTAQCYGDTITLDTAVPSATHAWYLDGTLIPGETTSTLTVSEPGEYSVDVVFSGSCAASDSVIVEFIPNPIIDDVSDLAVCNAVGATFDLTENDTLILGTQDPTEFTIEYFETLADAESGNNAIPNPTAYVGTNGQTIFIRIEDNITQSCYETGTFLLNILDLPVINPVPDMHVCDDDSNDGVGEEFMLTDQDLGILGVQLPADFDVTYHLNFADADAGVNALVSPYTNISNSQPIFVRVEATNADGCYIASPLPVFNLVVDYRAIANAVPDMVLCDDDTDGFIGFDLESQTTGVLGAQDGNLFTVTYHETAGEAAAGTGALTSLYTNTSNNQTIHVRIEEDANPVCYGTTTFNLVVNPLPVITPVTPLEVCDDASADGFADFNLVDKDAEVLNGQTDIAVTYYETLADAEAGTGNLASPYTNIVVNSQTVFIRLENGITGCVSTTQMDLVVNSLPIPGVAPAIELCDDDADGMVSFDLSVADAAIINGQAGTSVTYHEDQADADAGVDAIGPIYTNTVINSQFVVARLENDATGCHATTTLQLIVHPLPVVGAINDYELCDYNNTGDEVEIFDLTTMDTEIANGQNVSIAYYESLGNAQTGTGAIVVPYANTSNNQVIYAVLTNNGTGCESIATFNLVVNPLPILVDPTPLEVCDDNVPDGITEIDLSLKDEEIRGGNSDYAITYYLTLADAESGTGQLPTLYTNLVNNQVIFVRGEDINTGCYSTTSLELVVEQAPVANIPQPLHDCDPDVDGIGSFMLTDADADVIGTGVGLFVTYHETMADANNNVNALSSPYTNIVADFQIVYARVESVTILTDCATIVPLELYVHEEPQIVQTPPALETCDDISADGVAQFDLTDSEDSILNGVVDPAAVAITYHETQANAESNTASIAVPTSYSNIPPDNTVWVRVEYTATGCYQVAELELLVNPLPVLVQPNPLNLCDYNNTGDGIEEFTLEDSASEILNGQTGISLTFHSTQAGADGSFDEIFSPYANTANAQTIYVRAENDITGCYNTITLDLRVNPLPLPEPQPALEVCDDDNDGIIGFDLSVLTTPIINGANDVSISYYETMADADAAVNALPDTPPALYTNIVADLQIIFVRAEDDITGCYSIITQELVVLPSPVVPVVIDDYVICDDDNDGMDVFDLTTMDATIYGSQDPADFDLSYHESLADAESGIDPIVNLTNYINTLGNPQTIYVRLVSVANGCVTTGEFNLVVALPPEPILPTPLEVCDDDRYDEEDEVVAFDLTLKDDEITGSNPSWVVSYYETDAEAQSDTNAIDPATAYENTSVGGNAPNPQTLYVRVTDVNTGCYAFTTLTIRVLPNPEPLQDAPDLELCNDTIDPGSILEESFNLQSNEAYILNGATGMIVTYHESDVDAEAGANAIADPTDYTNTATTPQTIYVRVTDAVTGCYTIVDFDVIVHPLPVVSPITDYIACEPNTDDVYQFDLTTKTDEVLNGQDSAIFEVSYHETLADAQAGVGDIIGAYTNTSDPQEIFVNITNINTGCDVAFLGFLLRVDEIAYAEDYTFELCDDNVETDGDTTNDVTQFDLSTIDSDVIGTNQTQAVSNYAVTYYATAADAAMATNALPSLYENTVNPQIIYARVDNNTPVVVAIPGGGLDLTTLTAALDFNNDGVDDTYDTDGDGVFDLVDIDADGVSDAIDVDANGTVDYIDVDGDGIGDAVDLDGDGDFDFNDNLADSSACSAISEVTLQVNPLPIIDLDTNYLLCLNRDGSEVINQPAIDPGLSAALYSFEWTDASGTVVSTAAIFEPTAGGVYTLLVTDTSSSLVTMCQSSFSFTVDVSSRPIIDETLTMTTTVAFAGNHQVDAVATGDGVYEFSIDDGPWMLGTESPDNVWTYTFTNVNPGEQKVRVRDINGCGDAEYDIIVIDYPPFFTPNGDAYHETWQILGLSQLNNVKIYIFDRYGKLLKQLNPSGDGWDGTYNGSPLPSNDYWFLIEYEEGDINKEFKAHFTLKR
jgi:gliding motility-associated-like protein